MFKYYKIIFISCFFISCHVDKEETVTLEIVNSLDSKVRIEFYDRGFPSGIIMNEIQGQGSLFKGSDTGRVVLIHEIMDADSIVLIFDNQKFESHLLLKNIPVGNSIFDGENYPNINGINTYTITQENYDNAIPCNSSCI